MSISSAALFANLLSDLGVDGEWTPFDTVDTIHRKNLSQSILKKFQDTADKALTERVALDTFLQANKACGEWQIGDDLSSGDEHLLALFKSWMYRFFRYDEGDPSFWYCDTFDRVFELGRCGPGSSVGSNSTDFYSKLWDSNLSVTDLGLYDAYVSYIRRYPLWSHAEQCRQDLRGPCNVVAGSRLSFVPKSDKTARTICVEPVLNMFAQLGLGSIIEKRLDFMFRLRLDRQPFHNRELARVGSLTNDMSTIDLSSASDSISMRMLEVFLPPEFLRWLKLLRSPVAEVPGLGSVELKMVSSMGNGFTFPLETAIFCCIVMAAFDAGKDRYINNHFKVVSDGTKLLRQEHPGNWGVFGDDIIVPKAVTPKVLRLLELLGFRVNHDKTFTDGPFRESCGADYFLGVDVRGVYLKTLRTVQDRFTAVNLLNRWSAKTGIPLPQTVRFLLRGLPRMVVPPWEGADSGVWVPERLLHSVRSRVRKGSSGSYLYQRYVARPPRYKIDTECEIIHIPKRGKPRRFNRSGLYLAFLQGTVRNGVILLRPEKVRFERRNGVAPNWESTRTSYSASVPWEDQQVLLSNLHCTGGAASAAVESNLSSWLE